MMLIVGTVPDKDVTMTIGEVVAEGDYLLIGGKRIQRTQGTGAMISSALAVTEYMKLPPPHALLGGDIGEGKGTREIYQYLTQHLEELAPKVIALHYCLPIMALVRRLCEAVKRLPEPPFMIADAGAMYAAKAAGLAPEFDIFTPDASEMAFLADPHASHPAYVGEHLFRSDSAQVPQLVEDAYKNRNAAKLLVIKGATDYIAEDGKILATITEPNVPELEPIGGTGDTITGLVTALVYAGYKPGEAGIIAAKVNRMAGQIAGVTPATKISEFIGHFAETLKIVAPSI
ncbi:NAD(P)H-hydrate dehydratase [Chloroflexota bacterium]